jgi:carboxyl-terminal processing protease
LFAQAAPRSEQTEARGRRDPERTRLYVRSSDDREQRDATLIDTALVTTQPYRGTDALRGLGIPPTVVEVRRLDPTTGYLKIVAITTRTPGEVGRALAGLAPVQRLVLDLRGNGGGRIDAAREVAELFVPSGTVLYFERQAERVREVRSRGSGEYARLSVTVLIDGGTASAAELLAGVLTRAGPARLLGTRSAGKGTILTAQPEDDNRVRWIESGELLLPDGAPITGRGLEPGATDGPRLKELPR